MVRRFIFGEEEWEAQQLPATAANPGAPPSFTGVVFTRVSDGLEVSERVDAETFDAQRMRISRQGCVRRCRQNPRAEPLTANCTHSLSATNNAKLVVPAFLSPEPVCSALTKSLCVRVS